MNLEDRRSMEYSDAMEILALESLHKYEIILQAVRALQAGQIVVVPTDTVYGLAVDATHDRAVETLFRFKARDEGKPMPIFVVSEEQAREVAFLEEDRMRERLMRFWPGPLTAVLYARERVSPKVRGRGGLTVGLRIPDHAFLRELMGAFGKPITGTSANISGGSSYTDIGKLIALFGERPMRPDVVIDAGNLPDRKPSTVIDFTLTPPKVLREGAVASAVVLQELFA